MGVTVIWFIPSSKGDPLLIRSKPTGVTHEGVHDLVDANF